MKPTGTHEAIDHFEIPGTHGLYSVTKCGKVYSKRINRWLKLSLDSMGYPRFRMFTPSGTRTLRVHRAIGFVFLGVKDEWPARVEIDHIDRDRTNCCLSNLRVVSHSANMKNKKFTPRSVTHLQNKSGVRGVAWCQSYGRDGRWVAKLGTKRIGAFHTKEEAVQARAKALSMVKINGHKAP